MLITKGPLYCALAKLGCLVSRKPKTTILGHVLVEAEDDLLTVTAGDGRTTATITLACQHGDFSRALPFRDLKDFLRPLDRADRAASVELRQVEDGKVVVAQEGAFVTLASLASDEFPTRPSDLVKVLDSATWSTEGLATALDYLLPVVVPESTRLFATGISVEPQRLATCDGSRLHIVKMRGLAHGPVIHRTALEILRALLPRRGEVRVEAGPEVVRFITRAWVVDTKPLDVSFPPIDQVIPAPDQGFTIEAEAALLSAAAKRFPCSRGGQPPSIQLTVNGQIDLKSKLGDSAVSVPLTQNGHVGEPLVLGINQSYLADAIGTDEGRVQLSFGGALDPIVVTRSPDRLAVVMPVRL